MKSYFHSAAGGVERHALPLAILHLPEELVGGAGVLVHLPGLLELVEHVHHPRISSHFNGFPMDFEWFSMEKGDENR